MNYPPPPGPLPDPRIPPQAWPALAQATLEERRQALSFAIAHEVSRGGRIESMNDTTAIIVVGSKPNHILHLILTLVTCSAWGVIWIMVAIGQQEHRISIAVDQYGQAFRQQIN